MNQRTIISSTKGGDLILEVTKDYYTLFLQKQLSESAWSWVHIRLTPAEALKLCELVKAKEFVK